MITPHEMDACRYLYLGGLSEPKRNALRALVLEAKDTSQNTVSTAGAFTSVTPIVHSRGCRIFELNWETYVAYSVRNETFARVSADEYQGRLFRVCSKSQFIDYAAVATAPWTAPGLPGPAKLWQIVTLDHVLDVVSTVEPTTEVRIAV